MLKLFRISLLALFVVLSSCEHDRHFRRDLKTKCSYYNDCPDCFFDCRNWKAGKEHPHYKRWIKEQDSEYWENISETSDKK